MAVKARNTSTGTTNTTTTGGRTGRSGWRTAAGRSLVAAVSAAATTFALLTTAAPATASSEVLVGTVNGCGSAQVKATLWGQWQAHTGCNSVRDLDTSPDGQYYGVINADGSLAIKQGMWGTWQQHLGPNDTRDVALGRGGLVGVVNGCGAAYVKTTIGGAWQQHTGCGTVSNIEVSPDGQYFAVINTNGSLAIKQGLWGTWQQHVGPSDARDVAFGPGGMVGIVNGCGAAYVKTSIYGAWQQHTGCNSVTKIEISPDGQHIGVVNANGSLAIKQGLWGTWRQHIGSGDARDVTFASAAGRSAYALPVPRAATTRDRLAAPHHDYPALDLPVATGTAVYSVVGGRVTSFDEPSGCGTGIRIDAADGSQYTYCHLSSRSVTSGSTVDAGHQLGLSGNTGRSSGPHLHLQVLSGGSKRCPQNQMLAIWDGSTTPPAAGSLPTSGCSY